MRLFWIVSRAALLHFIRGLLDRHSGAPIVVVLPALACVLWFVFLGRVFGTVIPSEPVFVNQFMVTIFCATFALVFITSGLLNRLRRGANLLPGNRLLPISPVTTLAVEMAACALLGMVIGILTTLPFATHVLIPNFFLSIPRIATAYTSSLITWLAAAVLGVSWSHWTWVVVQTTASRVHDLVLHLVHAVAFAVSFLMLGTLTLSISAVVVPLPVWIMTNAGIPVLELLALFLGSIFAASATELARNVQTDRGHSWVPLSGVSVYRSAWAGIAIVTVRRVVRDAANLLTAAIIPLIFLGISLVVKALPQLDQISPIVLLSILYVIPTSFASVVLALDLYTVSSQWLLALPIRPTTLVLSEAAAGTGTALILSVIFSAVSALILRVTAPADLLALIVLVTLKTISMAGVGLLLTCVVRRRIHDNNTAILLGLLFALGTAFTEGLLYWLAAQYHTPQGIVSAILAIALFMTGVTCRWVICLRGNRDGLADQ